MWLEGLRSVRTPCKFVLVSKAHRPQEDIMTIASNKTPDTLLDNERADALSNLEDMTDRLMNEWDRNDEIPVVSEEFYADLAAFTERWFGPVVDR